MTVTLKFALLYAYMMRCTQNKFTIFFIGLSLLGRVGSGKSWVGLGRKKVTHVQLCSRTTGEGSFAPDPAWYGATRRRFHTGCGAVRRRTAPHQV